MKLLKLAVLASATTLLLGCASSYQKFYRPASGVTPETVASVRANPPTDSPTVHRAPMPASAADGEALVDQYARRSYSLIGSSFFSATGDVSETAAIEQAKVLKADLVVLFTPRNAGTSTRAVPISLPSTQTSVSSGSATAFGSGGSVNVSGRGTTTTYGSTTTLIPMTVNHTDHGAAYFVKRRWTLGVMWRDLSDTERQMLQSNKGIAVRLVVEGTPAFMADILAGDLIVSIDGQDVLGQQSATELIQRSAGRKVEIGIWRSGARLTKSAQL